MPTGSRTDTDSIEFDDATIEYEVRRSARRKKTVQISVDGGAVRVAAPATMTDCEVRSFVRQRADWIVKRSAEQASRTEEPLRFVSGETLPYLGRSVELAVEFADVDEPRVRFECGRLRVSAPRDLPEPLRPALVSGVVMGWFKTRAEDRLNRDVDRWWPTLGRGDRSRSPVLIGDQRRRWGSCSSDGTLRFSWRVMMLEPSLIDYIVVHELAHLSVMNHSQDFWAIVASVMPDVRIRRDRLREAGRALPM